MPKQRIALLLIQTAQRPQSSQREVALAFARADEGIARAKNRLEHQPLADELEVVTRLHRTSEYGCHEFVRHVVVEVVDDPHLRVRERNHGRGRKPLCDDAVVGAGQSDRAAGIVGAETG
ncbi:MAG: hypothetical protein M3435_00325 [Actinomycetota bacterium]|nr:hypothetical protein [Actinomycetota bacterium]